MAGLCLAMFPTASMAGDEGILVDEVAAVVNRNVITRSEVVQEGVLVLVQRQGEAGLSRRMTPDFLGQVLDMLINQRILLDEALRMALSPVSGDERGRLLEGFKAKFVNAETYARFLFRHGLRENVIAEVLARHLMVERLKERKLRSLPEVNDDAVRRYYQKHLLQLGGKDLSLVAEAIRLKLMTQQREKLLSKWVWELRKRSEVKVLVDFTQASAVDG